MVAVAVLLAGGCTQTVNGTPAPVSSPTPAPATAAPAPASSTAPAAAGPPAGGCRVTISGQGSIRMAGGGRVRTVNNARSFACRNGPLVAIEAVDAAGVRFSVDGADVLVADGSTAAVGSYRVTVVNLDGQAAEFDVVPSG